MKRPIPTVLVSCLAWSSFASADTVQVSNAWARATAPGQKVAAIFMDLKADADMRLVAGDSPLCGRIELHTMRMEGGMMVMRQVPDIPLPKGQTVNLKPGGLHVMCIDIKQALKANSRVPLTLAVRGAGGEQKVQVEAEVRPAGEGRPMPHMH